MNKINYITGNALEPVGNKKKMILHICNDVGGWGAGFVVAISKKWKEPEQAYRLWHQSSKSSKSPAYNTFHLGMVQAIKVKENIQVCNMIGQHGVGQNTTPIRYEAVEDCLNKVAESIGTKEISVHMPRIGCGLAGGKWDLIEEIIIKTLINKGIETYVYSLNKDNSWK